MATKDEIYGIVAAYGLGRVLPQGSTRAAARAAINGIVKSGKIVIPAAARAAPSIARTGLNLARVNPYASAALLGYGAYEAGLLDPALDRAREGISEAAEDLVIPLKKTRRRRASGFNNAISAGMKAIKASKFMGKRGLVVNPKKAFSTVTKTVSALRAGRKVAKTGARGVIARAARRYL